MSKVIETVMKHMTMDPCNGYEQKLPILSNPSIVEVRTDSEVRSGCKAQTL